MLSKENQGIYYSSWVYAAVHMAVTIPQFQTRKALSQYLGISQNKISSALDFLIEAGLAESKNGDRFTATQNQTRLGNDSHNIIKHHSNWRTRALEYLDREEILDLHYSSVFSLSKNDIRKVKGLLLDLNQKNADIVKLSAEEELHAICIDFFSLSRPSS